MLLVNDFLKQWEDIVDQVDKDRVPIECVRKIIFRTHNRRQKTINLRSLRSQGLDEENVDLLVTRFIEENEDSIASMEFVLDVEAIADMLQPETDKLLKGMK